MENPKKPAKANDLQRYFDGELSLRRAKQVQRGLAADSEDRAQLQLWGAVGEAIREDVAAAADGVDFATFHAKVRRRITAAPPLGLWERYQVTIRRGLWSVGIAAAAVIAAVAIYPAEAEPEMRNDCVIESLELGPSAVSTIFTIDDPELADSTTVIWVSDDHVETAPAEPQHVEFADDD